ncbi:MAG: hypothetical protein FWH04_02495 [Oscillospiraceae bacterium]|nr:hypothetical protein [Oscillospiraceae bacterium]
MTDAISILEEYKLPSVKPTVKTLGKDEFLQLLIVQLQNQDPSSPMENSDMMQQMAVMAQMDSIATMSSSALQSQTYSMIGKGVMGYIYNEETGTRTSVIGVVDSAGTESGKPYVKIDGKVIYVENITQVFDQGIITGASQAVNTATSMVGKYVRANIGTAEEPEYIEGRVERWQTKGSSVYVTIGGTDVILNQVMAVANTREELGATPVVTPPSQETPEEDGGGGNDSWEIGA